MKLLEYGSLYLAPLGMKNWCVFYSSYVKIYNGVTKRDNYNRQFYSKREKTEGT